jgi:hypothetical protein
LNILKHWILCAEISISTLDVTTFDENFEIVGFAAMSEIYLQHFLFLEDNSRLSVHIKTVLRSTSGSNSLMLHSKTTKYIQNGGFIQNVVCTPLNKL